jgi:hypothetical protein
MKGKALVMVGILVLVLGVAIVGPIPAAAAQDYEPNWSWPAYTPEAHTWSAFGGEHKQHNWSAFSREEEPHDWSWQRYEPAEHNWSAFDGEHEQHDWSWMLPEPGATFNPNAGWWG